MILLTRRAKFWMLVNNDIVFRKGRLAQVMLDPTSKQSSGCLWGLVGDKNSPCAVFILTARALKLVGLFDENFWPAYAEDCDYTARLVRAKCPIIFAHDTSEMAEHVSSASIKLAGNSSLPRWVRQSSSGFNNFDYLTKKWGVNVRAPRSETTPYMSAGGFALPFNKSNDGLSSWRLDVQRRLARGGPRECVICDS